MSKVDIDELERLAKAATPGPWKVFGHGELVITGNVFIGHVCADMSAVDAAYIAAANPSTVLALLEELRLARVVVEGSREALQGRLLGVTLVERALAAYDAHVKGGGK